MKKFGINLSAVVLCRSCAGKLTPCLLVQRWVFSLQASNFGGGDLVSGLTELSGFGCQQLEVCRGEKGGFPPRFWCLGETPWLCWEEMCMGEGMPYANLESLTVLARRLSSLSCS